MRIGAVAAAAGVTVQAVRFYERRGLIKLPRRLSSGYRDYPPEAVTTLETIKQLQAVGFTLRETAEFIRLLEGKPHDPAKNRALAEEKLCRLEAQIARLGEMRDGLRARLVACTCCNELPPVLSSQEN